MQLKIKMLKNYYISSFFWSTLSKILNAIVNFFSIPFFLSIWGKADYGVLSLATACNSYMSLMDLGMNIGSVKFFSAWIAEGEYNKIYRIARTNITFYGIISLINIFVLIALVIWGKDIFSLTYDQFKQLQSCLIIIAIFSIFNWGATTFNQLLIADKQISFTMQMQCILALLKGLLVAIVFLYNISLTLYFLYLTALTSLLIIPYIIKCKRNKLIDSLRPATYWKEFNDIIKFSLSIFALSLFQMTATQSRPIVLSIFSPDGAESVADFRIIEVIPSFIIMICGTMSGIFLPKASEIIAKNNIKEIKLFAYRGTVLTSILATSICTPFIICSKEILSAYVGVNYTYLTIWLIIWLFLVLLQIHSTPANALILSKGKTLPLVIISGVSCIISIIINGLLAPQYRVGSSIIGYTIYIIINLFFYYFFFYSKYLSLKRTKILKSFVYPSLIGLIIAYIVNILLINFSVSLISERIDFVLTAISKACIWFILYVMFLLYFKIIRFKNGKVQTFIESES